MLKNGQFGKLHKNSTTFNYLILLSVQFFYYNDIFQ